VEEAKQSGILDRREPAEGPGADVIELEAPARAADPARVELPLAAASVARPDRALHLGRDAVAIRWPPLLARPRDLAAELCLVREKVVESRLEHRRARGVRAGVRHAVSRALELVEELLGDGEMEASELGREGLRF
jgi:hypothetical protein